MPVTLFFLAAALLLALWGAWHDWRSLRIPNWISLAIAALFLVAATCMPGDFSPLWIHVAAGAGMLAVTFTMFALGHFGGGDAKLASALALWLGLKGLVPFVMFSAIAGGVLGIAGLYIKRRKPFAHAAPQGWVAQVQAGRDALPYGIALAIGVVAAVFHTAPYAQKLHELIILIH